MAVADYSLVARDTVWRRGCDRRRITDMTPMVVDEQAGANAQTAWRPHRVIAKYRYSNVHRAGKWVLGKTVCASASSVRQASCR